MMGNRVRVRKDRDYPMWVVDLFGRGGWQTICWCHDWAGALGVANRAAVGRWP